MGTVDEHDDVGVLLDGAGFAKVGKLRAAVIALWSAGELAEDEDGNLQFLGETLEAARDAGDFFLAIAEAATRSDQLKIIDDEKRETFVALEAAGFGADFEDADGAGVVDPDGRGINHGQSVGHAAPVLAGEAAGAEMVRVNLGDGSDEALEQRFLGHFEAEEGNALSGANGDVFGEVEGERGFSLRGARGEDQELGRLKAGSEAIQVRVAGGDAGDALALAENPFEALSALVDDFLDGSEAAFGAVFSESENGRFGGVENGVGGIFGLEGLLLNVVGGVNKIAKDGFFFDDAGVVLDVGNFGHAVGKSGEIGSAAGGFQIAVAVKFFGESDEVDGVLGFAESDHLVKDAAVLIEEKVSAAEMLDGGVERMVIEQNGAEDGTLGVEIVRKRPFEDGISRHSVPSLFAFSSLLYHVVRERASAEFPMQNQTILDSN